MDGGWDETGLRRDALRRRLRAATRDAHERLHRHRAFAALFDQDLDLRGYRHLMYRLYGFYRPLDRAVAGQPARGAFRPAPRAGRLAQDLAALGYAREDIDAAPLCHDLAALVTAETLPGVVYVIEGATLGGARIDRAAARLLDPDRRDGRRFWAWCRAESAQRWAMMLACLDTVPADDGATEAALRGANGTFAALADWLAPLDRADHTAGQG